MIILLKKNVPIGQNICLKTIPVRFCLHNYSRLYQWVYRQTSNTSCTKSKIWISPFVDDVAKSIEPGVKSRMKIVLEQRQQAMLQLHLSD